MLMPRSVQKITMQYPHHVLFTCIAFLDFGFEVRRFSYRQYVAMTLLITPNMLYSKVRYFVVPEAGTLIPIIAAHNVLEPPGSDETVHETTGWTTKTASLPNVRMNFPCCCMTPRHKLT